jgi:hypothetical protein
VNALYSKVRATGIEEKEENNLLIKRYIQLIKYSKPSLIQLQLILISENPDRNMKNEKFCS